MGQFIDCNLPKLKRHSLALLLISVRIRKPPVADFVLNIRHLVQFFDLVQMPPAARDVVKHPFEGPGQSPGRLLKDSDRGKREPRWIQDGVCCAVDLFGEVVRQLRSGTMRLTIGRSLNRLDTISIRGVCRFSY